MAPAARAARVAFWYEPEPGAFLLDLAVQAAGAIAVPLAGSPVPDAVRPAASLAALGCGLWAGPGCPAGPLHHLELPPDSASRGRGAGRASSAEVAASHAEAGSPAAPPAGGTGGALTWSRADRADRADSAAAAVGVRLWSAAALAAAAARLAARLAPPAARRDVLVSWRPLHLAGERLLVAWGLASGAALLLERDAQALAATVEWARPTLLHGDAGELGALRRELLARCGDRPERLRRRLDRVRAALVVGGADALSGSEIAAWAALGIPLLDCRELVDPPAE